MSKVEDGTTINARVLEYLATFLRLRSIYPANNHRVQSIGTALIDLVENGLPIDEIVALRFGSDQVQVGAEKFPLKGAPICWAAEMMHRTSLVGVELRHGVGIDVLSAFAIELQRCAFPVPTQLAPRWDERQVGLRPLPLVIDGHHAGDALSEELLSEEAHFAAHPQVRDRLQRIRALMDRLGPAPRNELPVDLLKHVTDLIAADGEREPEEAIELVCQLLDGIDTQLSLAAPGGHDIDKAVHEAAIRVARRFFTHADQRAAPVDVETLPSGRPEDESVVDDLALLFEEMKGVGWEPTTFGFESTEREHSHLFAILVELIADSELGETAVRAARRIAQLIESGMPVDLAPLDECLAPQRADGPGFDPAQALRAFLAADCGGIAFGRAAVSLEAVAAVFPRFFCDWLARLRPSCPADHAATAEVVRLIGVERFYEGLRTLARGRELDDERTIARLAFLLDDAAPAAVGALLAGGCEPARAVAFQLLPGWADLGDDGLPLRLLPHESVPTAQLAALCRLAAGDRSRLESVREEWGVLLRAFVLATERRGATTDLRVSAVKSLAAFPSSQTTLLLEKLARPWPAGKEGKDIRRAAAEALRGGAQ